LPLVLGRDVGERQQTRRAERHPPVPVPVIRVLAGGPPVVAAFGTNGNESRQGNTGWDAGAARRKDLSSGGTGFPAGVDKTRTRFVGRS